MRAAIITDLISSEPAEHLPADSASAGADPSPVDINAASAAQPQNGLSLPQPATALQQSCTVANNIVIREVEYIQALTERINALIASNERVMKTYRKYFWHLGLLATFLRGILMGFGWVIGTTIVVGVFILFLHSFDSVPLVGEFVRRIMDYLEQRR